MTKSHAAPFPFETMLKQFSDANQSLVHDWQTRFNLSLEPNGGFAETYQQFIGAGSQNSEQWSQLQQNYQASQMKLWESFLSHSAVAAKDQTAPKGDRRFSAAEWSDMPLFDFNVSAADSVIAYLESISSPGASR